MVRTMISVLALTTCLAAQAAEHGRVARLSNLPVAAQARILETVHEDAPWMQLGELSASDGTTSDSFGMSVAIDRDTVIVGAPTATVNGNENQGAAYIFVKAQGGWENMTQVAKFTASDGQSGDGFGGSVAISGDTAVVGDPFGTYFFVMPRTGWKTRTESAKVPCGSPVAIDGDTVACGSAGTLIYVRPKSGWKRIKTYAAVLEASNCGRYWGGGSVSINGDSVVVGDYSYNNLQGAVYLFVKPKAGWGVSDVRRIQTQTAKLTASDGAADDAFGWSVAIHGDAIAVGAPYHTANGCLGCGASYVFVKPADGWSDMTQTAELTDAHLQGSANFGYSVAIQGRHLVVGNNNGDNGNNHLGSAYLFIEPSGGWTNTQGPNATLTASDGQRFDQFGISAAISGKTIVIGSDRSNINLTGATYVFGP